MSAGASGGADIEGRAFDAGPTAQNESAASIGEAAGLSGQAAKDYGMAQLDALDAQHGTNFGQRARGLTGNNSIGTAELDSFGFDADAPAGLQHAQQRTAFEQGLFDPDTMTAQLNPTNLNYTPVYDFSLYQPATQTTPAVGNVQNRVGTLMSHPDLSMIDYGMDENTTVPGAFALFSNPDLQHELAAHHLTSLVEGYRGLPRDVQTNLRSDARHAMGVQSVGLGPMNAYEAYFSDDNPNDYAANLRAAEALANNPDISTRDLIGQVALGTNNALSQEESNVYNLDNAYAQLDLDPFYNWINPALEAIKNSALAETAKQIDAVPIPGLEVIQGLDIGKKALDAIPGIMGVDFPSYGPDIPGRAQDDVFEPSMDLQMEFGPIMDSNLQGVEGFMEAGGFLGGGSGVIGPDFDMGAVSEAGGEALQEALAQRVAETIIAQQAARQVTPESNKVTIPTSSGPNIVIDVTPPAPQKVAPHRRTAPKPSPIKVAAKTITKPKAFKALPKFVQNSLRQGKIPDGMKSHHSDMVTAFLAPPEPVWQPGSRTRPPGSDR